MRRFVAVNPFTKCVVAIGYTARTTSLLAAPDLGREYVYRAAAGAVLHVGDRVMTERGTAFPDPMTPAEQAKRTARRKRLLHTAINQSRRSDAADEA